MRQPRRPINTHPMSPAPKPTPSPSSHTPIRHVDDVEAQICVFHVADIFTCGVSTQRHQPFPGRCTVSAKTREGAGYVKIGSKTLQMTPASSGGGSAHPGDIAGDRVHICARSRRRPPPGSPYGLPGRFQDQGKEGLHGAARFFVRAASAIILYVL